MKFFDNNFWFWMVFGMTVYCVISSKDISVFCCTMALMLFVEYSAKEIIKTIKGEVDDNSN